MANYTPNLNLKKPTGNEYYDVVAEDNDSKDKIDNAVGENKLQFEKSKITRPMKYKDTIRNGRSIILDGNAGNGYVNRAVLTKSQSELVIVKNDALNPATIPLVPLYPLNPITAPYIEFILMSPDISQIQSIQFKIEPGDGGYYHTYDLSNQLPKRGIPYEPLLMRVKVADLVNVGATGPVHLLSTGFIVLLITGNLNATLIIPNGIFYSVPQNTVMFQFDDGEKSVYEKAFPEMRKRGIVGTFNVLTTDIGSPAYCTWDQLREMQAAGWTIGNHTSAHTDLMTLSVTQALTNVQNGQFVLATNGFTGSRCLVPPYNSLDDARAEYFRHVMLTRKAGAKFSTPLKKSKGYVMIQSKSVVVTDTLNTLKTAFNTAMAEGDCFSPCFHSFIDGTPEGEYLYDINIFIQFLDWLLAMPIKYYNGEEFCEEWLIK